MPNLLEGRFTRERAVSLLAGAIHYLGILCDTLRASPYVNEWRSLVEARATLAVLQARLRWGVSVNLVLNQRNWLHPVVLPDNFPLKSGHKLWMRREGFIFVGPPIVELFDLETPSGNFKEIKTVAELAQVIGEVNTKEHALGFVEFFSSEPTMYSLKPNRFSGIVPVDSVYRMPSSLARLLTPPNIEKVGGQWIIERDLFLYPNRLVRSQETISQTGAYTSGIKQVLSEGDEVAKLLPYYE